MIIPSERVQINVLAASPYGIKLWGKPHFFDQAFNLIKLIDEDHNAHVSVIWTRDEGLHALDHRCGLAHAGRKRGQEENRRRGSRRLSLNRFGNLAQAFPMLW